MFTRFKVSVEWLWRHPLWAQAVVAALLAALIANQNRAKLTLLFLLLDRTLRFSLRFERRLCLSRLLLFVCRPWNRLELVVEIWRETAQVGEPQLHLLFLPAQQTPAFQHYFARFDI